MAQNTEKAIADALKTLLAKRPLNKITISDITNECGINRMTFYYHYHDVYDLLRHIFDEMFRTALDGKRTLADWKEGICILMEEMQNNKAFFSGAYQSVDTEWITRYLHGLISELLQEGLDQVTIPENVTEKQCRLIRDFYAYAFCGLLLQWVRKGMKESPAELTDGMDKIGRGGLARALAAFSDPQ